MDTNMKILIFTALFFFTVSFGLPVFSQDWSGDNAGAGESQIVQKKSEYMAFNPDKDPFFPLVRKKKRKRRQTTRTSSSRKKSSAPSKPVVQEIDMDIIMIVGNEERRVAMVNFNNQPMELTKGSSKAGFFKVVDIKENEVLVYSEKTKRRRIFKLKN